MIGVQNVKAQDAGTYYIQNVSTGKWLAPGNDWGTQASALSHADYWKLAKISNGVYTLESVVSNGGTDYYLTGTYCDGAATNFTFNAVAGKASTYTIANSSGGLLTVSENIVNVSGSDATAEVSQWKLWSVADMSAGMAAATSENPFDATYLIKDHDLGRNNRDYSSWSNTGATAPKTASNSDWGDKDGKAKNGSAIYSIEAYQKTFDVKQTLSGIPNGRYALRVNGFYRQDGSNANLPYLYAGSANVTLPVRTGTENNMQAAAESFVNGNYLSDRATTLVTNNSLTVGVKTTGNSCWAIFKNFHLEYYGNAISYYSPAEFTNNTQVAAGDWKYYDVNAGWYKIASNAAITFYYSQDDSKDADGTESASISQGGYTYLKLTEGKLYFKSSADATITLTEGFVANDDITAFLLTNPNFTGNASGWEGSPSYQSNNAEMFDKYFDVYQTVANLPAGYYWVKAQAFDRQTNVPATFESPTSVSKAYLYAGDASILVKRIYDDASTTQKNGGTDELSFTKGGTTVYIPDRPGAGGKYFDAGLYDNELLMYHGGGDLRIGIKKYVKTSNDWCLFDNFRIIYAGSTPSNGADMTSLISNPSFETGDKTGWSTNAGHYIQSGSDLSNKVGTYYSLIQGKTTNRNINQTVNSLPAGKYVLSANARANSDAGSVTLNMGAYSSKIPVGENAGTYTVAYETEVNESSASVQVALSGGSGDLRRCYVDNFTLTYYETLPDVSITDLTSSAMAADVRAALTSASSTYNSSKTAANYNALQTAIVNAKVSIADFAGRTGADADWTDIIVNPAFTSNSSTGWTITGTSGNRQYGSSCAEAWNNNNVQYSQEIKYLPAGTYKLTAQVDNGRDNSNVSLFATCNSTTYSAAAPYRAISSYSATATALAGDANLCLTTIYLTVEEDEDLTIGVKDVSTGTGWMIFDSFKLTYNPTLPDELTAATGKMNSTVESTQTEKIAAYTGEKNISNLLDAQSAIYAAHQSVDVYKEITSIKNTYDTKAESLDEAGQSAYTTATTAVSGATTKYTAGEYTTSAQAETAYNADYITAVKAQGAGADLSDLITNSELFGKEYFDTETGTKSQTISGLANGYYLVKAQVFYRAGDKGSTSTDKNVKLFAASDGVTKYVFVQNINNYKGFASAQSTGTWKQVSSSFYVPDNTTAANYVFNTTNIYHNSVVIEVTNQSLELGINKIARTNRYDWAYWDNFQLQYLGASLPASLTAATGKMNSDVAAAQTTAVNAYNETSGQTVDNYNTAANAVILAEENKLMYTEINSAITGAAEKYQISSLNEAGQTEWAAQITHIEEKYNNGTYETFVAAQNDLSDARLAALTAQGGGSDWTTVIVNPSFEDGKTGWSVNYGSSTSHNSDEIQGGAGSRYFKSWRNTSDGGYVYQTINLPAGYYRLSVMIGAHQATNAKRFVKAGTTVQKDDVHHDYTRERLFVDFELSTAGNIEISAGCENSDEYHADDFLLTYLGNATATMQVSGTAKMGTFCAPFDVAIPDGVTAYEASMSSDEWVHLEEIEGGVIGAGTPVILSITADVTFSQTCYGVNTAENPDDRGVLKGLYEAETKLSGEHPYYIMQYYDNKTAFFRVPTGQSRNLGANRCYLQPESNLTPARIAIDGDDDDFTAINELKVIEAEAKTMKDGKYLVKGRIVIVKNGKAFDANGQKLN